MIYTNLYPQQQNRRIAADMRLRVRDDVDEPLLDNAKGGDRPSVVCAGASTASSFLPNALRASAGPTAKAHVDKVGMMDPQGGVIRFR